ncbi:MAG: hypothetical protein XD82_0562 [Methanoculleus marisnigri]|uniref:Uncharacterized protein n=1 Tax=Methanoculleus marisnigri TaxID=2198 RepID=A0A101GR25_9EURY|nr:MAG: hypothetical protein XD82_0562 [Methanoculleus marisnigri]
MKRAGFILLLAALVLCQGALAHMPGAAPAPEVDLGPIVVLDNGVPEEIGIDDIAAYHGELEGKEPDACICCVCMYRVLLAGISEVWGDEIPERSDIGVQSCLVSDGALHTAWYVTGTGPGVDAASAGRLTLVAPNGSALTDYSKQARMGIAKNRCLDDYLFEVTRLSTGESATLTLREDVFPEGFFELRRAVKVDKTATEAENAEFLEKWSSLRADLLQKPDYELFNEIELPEEEEPDVLGGGVFLALLCITGAGIVLMGKKHR